MSYNIYNDILISDMSNKYDLLTGEWNDSLTGDFIWSNTNVGEAVSDVMTPLAWSIFRHSFGEMTIIPGYNPVGNIAGRPYSNVSIMLSVLRLTGRSPKQFGDELGGGYDQFQTWISQSKIAIPLSKLLPVLRNIVRITLAQKNALRRTGAFLIGNPMWCKEKLKQLAAIQTARELADFWEFDFAHYGMQAFWMVFSNAMHYTDQVGKLRQQLTRLVGPEDASALLSSVSKETELLASLGPVVGAWRVHHGEWTREMFIEQYGHRAAFESQAFAPDYPDQSLWLDQLLEQLAESPVDVNALLAEQRRDHQASWDRFITRYPAQANSMHKRLASAAEAARLREAVRSEFVRDATVSRRVILSAGQFTSLGEDIFFLEFQEIWDALRGIPTPGISQVPLRKAAYEKQKSMPLYPPVIRGHFHPDAWLADPHRRLDHFDSHEITVAPAPLQGALITGMPGSAGKVVGNVRCIHRLEDGDQLQPGEILVTAQTNVGWTPIFPRAAAVVTDIGAPLSHAAIVARELGIPAVVGCRDATIRLKTGDRVRVDGAKGIVEIL
jgi:rifampicin phosphotransferase